MTRPLPAAGAGRRLDELYAEHERMVAGICRALLRDPHEAEDASQQTFLSAYNSLLGGAVPHDEAAWLATIARNECRLRIRKRMATPLPLDVELESLDSDPADLADSRAEFADVTAALAGLPERQREAVVLQTFLGLSYDEVSVAMSSSAPAVESLLSRARSQLNRQLRRTPALVRSPLALVFSIRDAVERLVGALTPTAEQAAAGTGGGLGAAGLAKLATAAAVTLAAGAVAIEPIVDRGDSAPARRQPSRSGEVRTEPALTARRSAGAAAPIFHSAKNGVSLTPQDAQHRRPRPSRPASTRLARTDGAYGNPDSQAAAAAAAQPAPSAGPLPAQPRSDPGPGRGTPAPPTTPGNTGATPPGTGNQGPDSPTSGGTGTDSGSSGSSGSSESGAGYEDSGSYSSSSGSGGGYASDSGSGYDSSGPGPGGYESSSGSSGPGSGEYGDSSGSGSGHGGSESSGSESSGSGTSGSGTSGSDSSGSGSSDSGQGGSDDDSGHGGSGSGHGGSGSGSG